MQSVHTQMCAYADVCVCVCVCVCVFWWVDGTGVASEHAVQNPGSWSNTHILLKTVGCDRKGTSHLELPLGGEVSVSGGGGESTPASNNRTCKNLKGFGKKFRFVLEATRARRSTENINLQGAGCDQHRISRATQQTWVATNSGSRFS